MQPYPFQECVAQLLIGGRNVILQAPTGAGKTRAALLPFQSAREQGLAFPRKCLYATPMRVLANQFAADYADSFPTVKIQTGEHADDPLFRADVTFATIDQVLSSFLLTPYSLSRRQANLNAGAVASSYLVFDEFHLFDPTSMLPTTLEMLRMLKGATPFLLMTATFSRDMLQGLAKLLDAKVVPGNDEERQKLQELPSQQKTRRYHACAEPLSAEAILARHRGRTLVVCNVVERAQRLFQALQRHPALGDAGVSLLHSRFLPNDRARIEADIRKTYHRDNRSANWIAVATQVIEVGLDISCDALHTELAPANAILQRAGRCARYEGENGDVFIYNQAYDRKGEALDLTQSVLPYEGMESECGAAWCAFAERDGQALRFDDEQQIVSAVHGPRDRRIVEGLVSGREGYRARMNQALRGEMAASSELIRQIASQQVVIHNDPKAILDNPFAYESFGLHMGVVRGLVKRWLDRAAQEQLDAVGVHALMDLGDAEESGVTGYGMVPVSSPRDAAGAALVVVHPQLAAYDRALGFLPDQGGDYVARRLPVAVNNRAARYGYHLEAYQAHALLVREGVEQLWPEVRYAADHLARQYGWPQGALRLAADLVALGHDTGKLSAAWQTWVVDYQRAIGRPVAGGFYAHTDYDPNTPLHRRAAEARPRRPAHAVEGAIAVARWLDAALHEEALVKAAFSAIARHHGPFARSFSTYALARGAAAHVAELIGTVGAPRPECDALLPSARAEDLAGELNGYLASPEQDGELLAYMLLVHLLRLADQEATALGSSYPVNSA